MMNQNDQVIADDLAKAVDLLLEAALYVTNCSQISSDQTAKTFYMEAVDSIRDMATVLSPSDEDFGGTNVVPLAGYRKRVS